MRKWASRKFTLFGKLTVHKSLVLAKIFHLLISLPNPPYGTTGLTELKGDRRITYSRHKFICSKCKNMYYTKIVVDIH